MVDRSGLAEGLVVMLLGLLLFATAYGIINAVDFGSYDSSVSALGLVVALAGAFWVLVSLRG